MDAGLLVSLNVGGVYFVTRRETLARSSSFFSGLVDSHSQCTELFVDRDPTHFRHVLNWIRGVRFLPDDETTLRELSWEADYYALADMYQSILSTKEYHSVSRSLHNISELMRTSDA